MNKIRFDDISDLLLRFDYSKPVILGFSYFLGLSALAGKTGESVEDVKYRISRLPSVDINLEYEELLGPLRDGILNGTYDELVWRFNGNINVREIKVTETANPIFVYNFRNHKIISEDERKVSKLHDAETIFARAMSILGQQFHDQNYDATKSFKAGVCAANLRAQADHKATANSAAYLDRYLPLIFGAANTITKFEGISWSKHLDAQIPLQHFLAGFPHELGEIIWAFQSSIFFRKGVERSDINEMDTLTFMKECKEKAIEFYNIHPSACSKIANKKNHWTMFPHFKSDFDERELVLECLDHILGYKSPSKSFAEHTTFKGLIIFSYFCCLCETIILQEREKPLN